ncbi:unnamed protein product [Prorocentrum cordatum]|uniref:Uncharacterized protein n=1 Tax=Prorocentrum cordatum TaxID=2364126 RepID=A0ABN9YGE2_9DINO|nr:unnamed protein product [Polarella glacialis]
MHRGTEQLVPLYQSCRANNGTGRLEAKKKDVSIEDCMELARAACQSSFGMEYPSGYGGEDRAECVLGGGIADLIEVGDVDCTAWTNEGNPMGGAFRLAVYSVVGKKDRGGGGQGARAGVRGHPVHDPVLLRGHGAQRGGHLGPDSAGLERHLRLRRLHGSPRLDRRQGPGWQRQQGHDCVLDKRAALPGRLGNGRRGRPVQGAQLDREGRSRRGVCAPAAQEVADREGAGQQGLLRQYLRHVRVQLRLLRRYGGDVPRRGAEVRRERPEVQGGVWRRRDERLGRRFVRAAVHEPGRRYLLG